MVLSKSDSIHRGRWKCWASRNGGSLNQPHTLALSKKRPLSLRSDQPLGVMKMLTCRFWEWNHKPLVGNSRGFINIWVCLKMGKQLPRWPMARGTMMIIHGLPYFQTHLNGKIIKNRVLFTIGSQTTRRFLFADGDHFLTWWRSDFPCRSQLGFLGCSPIAPDLHRMPGEKATWGSRSRRRTKKPRSLGTDCCHGIHGCDEKPYSWANLLHISELVLSCRTQFGMGRNHLV